eukprot:1144177-Rhodomonas_salina.1
MRYSTSRYSSGVEVGVIEQKLGRRKSWGASLGCFTLDIAVVCTEVQVPGYFNTPGYRVPGMMERDCWVTVGG